MKMEVLLLLNQAVILLYYSVSADVFIEEPGPGPVLSPVGTPVEFNCTVMEGFVVDWSLDLPDREPVTTDQRGIVGSLMMRGIEAHNIGTAMSRLVFSGRKQNSPVTVQCIAGNETDPSSRNVSQSVQVIIYGDPLPPTNLKATENGLGSLNVSWFLDFTEGVPVDFALTATNLNASTVEPMVISGIQDQHYVFTVENRCDVYSFQVTAMATGVNNASSAILTRTIPSTPDISLIEKSAMEHSLSKIPEDNFTLMVRIQNVNVCSEYPTVSYTVLVEDDRNRSVNQTVTVNDNNNITTISISDLVSDTRYSYYIFATNQFGNSANSTSVQLFTTDVQSVSIHPVGNTTLHSIQCSYVVGSTARGCTYSIMGDGGTLTGNITREDNSSEDTVDLGDFTCFSNVSVYDWENDSTVGTLFVHNIDINPTIMMCPMLTITTATTANIYTTGLQANDDPTTAPTLIVIFVVPVSILAFAVLISIIIIAVVYTKRRRDIKNKNEKNAVANLMYAKRSDSCKDPNSQLDITLPETVPAKLQMAQTAVEVSTTNEQLNGSLAANPSYLLNTPLTCAASSTTQDEQGPLYSSLTELSKSPPNGELSSHEHKTTDRDSTYCIVDATGCPQQDRNNSTSGALVFQVEEQGYSAVVVTASPKEKKRKLKIKKAALPMNVKSPQLEPSTPVMAGTTAQVDDDGFYSTVSNIPKQVGAENLKKLAGESPDNYAALNSVPVYDVLENPNEVRNKRTSLTMDTEAPPPLPVPYSEDDCIQQTSLV